MKRVGNLWPQIVSWQNLLDSAFAAARGKRKRPDVARFLADLETNVCGLQRELESGAYQPGEYRTFWIRDPKARQISAAPFRDRVVHHALTRVLEPVFEPRFTACSFASRKGYGQHLALKKAKSACAHYAYVLKADIRKYFPSIDHAVLKELLARVVKCEPTLRLAELIVDRSNAQEEADAYFPGFPVAQANVSPSPKLKSVVGKVSLYASTKAVMNKVREPKAFPSPEHGFESQCLNSTCECFG